jgi:hypothetical protein
MALTLVRKRALLIRLQEEMAGRNANQMIEYLLDLVFASAAERRAEFTRLLQRERRRHEEAIDDHETLMADALKASQDKVTEIDDLLANLE